jgi:hypothetical protein
MIRLTRDRTAQAIVAGFRGAQRIKRERELLDRRAAGLEPRSQVWKTAKEQLKLEADGKCGYCEGKASHVAHGDVEHYRPKTTYWWLAYCYDNYVFACQICNQSYKGAQFPMAGVPMPVPQIEANADLDAVAGTLAHDPLDAAAVARFDAAARAEQASIPDPYGDDPERLFSWSADDALGEVEIRPRDRSPSAMRAHDAAERCLGLNRDELRSWRWEIYEVAILLADTVASGQLDAALQGRSEDRLRQMMSVTGEFAGMVRFFVREVRGMQL